MKSKAKGLLERKMEDPAYKRRFEERYPLFKLEVQILNAIEDKGWTFADLARVMHTDKGNISRDLSSGRIRLATLSRIIKMGEAVGLTFLPVFVSNKKKREIVPKIQELIAA